MAEVAALLGVPLGVARVLLADMLADGSVQVHRTVDVAAPTSPSSNACCPACAGCERRRALRPAV